MSWKMDYLPAENLVVIECAGELTIQDLLSQTQAANKFRVENGAQGVLADFTAANVRIPLAEIYQLPDYYDKIGVSRQNRIAVVFPPNLHQHDKYQFYEDVCHNRGYHSRIFDNLKQARAWLNDGAGQTF